AGSRGGIIAAQVVEHLDPAYLVRLLEVAFDKLRPAAPIVLETINPACWLAVFSSYIRALSHARRVHLETRQCLVRETAFPRVTTLYNEPVPESVKMKSASLPPD